MRIQEGANLTEQKQVFPTRDEVLEEALRQKPDLFEKVGKDRSLSFIDGALSRISEFDHTASRRDVNLPKTKEEAEKLKAIIVFSAPGTYLKASKEDRYKGWPWSMWMDKRRIDYAAWLVRRITEIRIGERLTNSPDLSKSISEHGPYLLYSGREDERKDILEALSSPSTQFPRSKVILLEGNIDNTIDQVEQLYIPPEVDIRREDSVGLVLHSPQMLRMLHNMGAVLDANREAVLKNSSVPFPNFPFSESSPRIKPFPIVSPDKQNVTLEICGIIHYAFYASPPKASKEPYPCEM